MSAFTNRQIALTLATLMADPDIMESPIVTLRRATSYRDWLEWGSNPDLPLEDGTENAAERAAAFLDREQARKQEAATPDTSGQSRHLRPIKEND